MDGIGLPSRHHIIHRIQESCYNAYGLELLCTHKPPRHWVYELSSSKLLTEQILDLLR